MPKKSRSPQKNNSSAEAERNHFNRLTRGEAEIAVPEHVPKGYSVVFPGYQLQPTVDTTLKRLVVRRILCKEECGYKWIEFMLYLG